MTNSDCNKSLQSTIEEPEIHLLAVSSSTIEDQATVINDRLDCIRDMNVQLHTSKGVPIEDRLLFFTGDKRAM